MADGDGLAEWSALSDALLRGLVHSLNNRLTALSAFTELATLGDAEFTAADVLPAEIARMERVTALFRLLANDGLPPEALELRPVLDDAVALHLHHPMLRAIRCEVTVVGDPLPVRAPRWALVRLLVTLIESAKSIAAARGDEHLTVQLSGDEQDVAVTIADASATAYARTMAACCGATLAEPGGAVVLRLPTLPEVRRRERALAARG